MPSRGIIKFRKNEVDMPNLSVRKLDRGVYERLRIRATKHGVSMEEEVRRILYQAVSAPEKICDVFQKYFGEENGIDLDSINLRSPHNPIDFNK